MRAAALLLVCATSNLAAAAPMRVAVLEFTNGSTSRDFDPLGKGLQSMVTTDLAQLQSMQLVERARLQELQAELKLQKTDAIDAKSAVKLGKLAGATHLVSGSFTVVGDKMRIDARLFGVEDGTILLTAKDEGEKDAFFDLEKNLVKKLVDSVGQKPTPRERAEMGRMHTLDFEAFQKFSQGLALYDEKKYADAIAALRDAQKRDKDFKLAAMTLDEYERVISQMRSQATDLEQKARELDRLEKELSRERAAKDESVVVQKLYKVAQDKDPAKLKERLTAMYVIALAHGHGLDAIGRIEDTFAMQRTADTLAVTYYGAAQPLFAKLPLPLVVAPGWASYTYTPEKFDADFAYQVEELVKQAQSQPHKLVENLATPWQIIEAGQRFHFDRRQTMVLMAQLLALAEKLQPSADWSNQRLALASEFRRVLELDRSSSIYTQVANTINDGGRLRDIAEELERNKQLTKLLQTKKGTPLEAYFREYALLKYPNEDSWRWELLRNEFDREFKDGVPLQPKAAYFLNGLRTFPRYPFHLARRHDIHGYVLFGDHPVWAVGSKVYYDDGDHGGTGTEGKTEEVGLVTGPRTDERRANELRYMPERDAQKDTLALVDGIIKSNVGVSLVASYTPSADFWPPNVYPRDAKSLADMKLSTDRPEVGVFFGVRDVDAPRRPLKGSAVLIAKAGVRLVEFVENPKGSAEPYALTVLEKKDGDFGGATNKVAVRIVGDSVKVTVNGKAFSFKAPAQRNGFYGVWFRGKGYAAAGSLDVN